MDLNDNIRKLDKLLNKIKEAAREKKGSKNTSFIDNNKHKVNKEIDTIYKDINDIICALDKKFTELEFVDSVNKKKETHALHNYLHGDYLLCIKVEITDCSGLNNE